MNDNHDNIAIIKEAGFTLLAEGKSIKVKAEGYSMFPSIRNGSIIYIEPITSGSPPYPGEIVAWKRESGFVVHRLVRILKNKNQTLFITRGDSCSREDQPIPSEYIAGRVVRIENKEGKGLSYKNYKDYKPNYYFNRLILFFLLMFK
jgi:signal peptidase I